MIFEVKFRVKFERLSQREGSVYDVLGGKTAMGDWADMYAVHFNDDLGKVAKDEERVQREYDIVNRKKVFLWNGLCDLAKTVVEDINDKKRCLTFAPTGGNGRQGFRIVYLRGRMPRTADFVFDESGDIVTVKQDVLDGSVWQQTFKIVAAGNDAGFESNNGEFESSSEAYVPGRIMNEMLRRFLGVQ